MLSHNDVQGVSTMCDIFRGEINSAFEAHGGDALAAFDALEPIAHSLFERCTRSFRGVIVSPETCEPSTLQRKKLITPSAPLFDMLCNAHAAPTPYLFEALHSTVIPGFCSLPYARSGAPV